MFVAFDSFKPFDCISYFTFVCDPSCNRNAGNNVLCAQTLAIMKTTLVLLLVFVTLNSFALVHNDPPASKGPKNTLKVAVDREIGRRLFFPIRDSQAMGVADLVLGLQENGQLEVLNIQTDNPRIQTFIERRLSTVFVRKDLVVPGETFSYRLVFRKQ